MVQKYILAGVAAIGIGAAAGFASQRDISGAVAGGAAAVASTAVGITVAGNSGGNQEDKEHLEQKATDLEAQLQIARDEAKQTSEQTEQLQSLVTELQDKQQILEDSKHNAERELSELRSSLEEAIQVEESAGVDLASARQQLEDLTQQQQSLQDDIALKQQSLSELQASETELGQTIADRQLELEQLQAQINSLPSPEQPEPDFSEDAAFATESSPHPAEDSFAMATFETEETDADDDSPEPEAESSLATEDSFAMATFETEETDADDDSPEPEAESSLATEDAFAEEELFAGTSNDTVEPETSALSDPFSLESSDEDIEEASDFGIDDSAESIMVESSEESTAANAVEASDDIELGALLSEDSTSAMDIEAIEAVSESTEAFESTPEEPLASAESAEAPEFADEISLGELLGEEGTDAAPDAATEALADRAFADTTDEMVASEGNVEDSGSTEDMSLGELLSEPTDMAFMSESVGFESAGFEVSESAELSADAEAADTASLDELLGAIESDVVTEVEESAEDPNDVDAFFSSVDRSSITELTTSNAADSSDSNFADLFNDSSEGDRAESLVASLEPVAATVEQDDNPESSDMGSLNLAELLSESDD